MKKHIGIYARCSTKTQTVIQQLVKLKEYCHSAGYILVGEYVDVGISAFKKNRPEFQRLLEDVRRRKINMILIWKLDRFSRSLKELVNTIDKLHEYGCDLVSYSDKNMDTTTASGKLLFNVMASVCQFEKDIISERTKLKLEYLKQKGVKLGRPQKLDHRKIFELRKKRLSLSAIANKVGCDRSTVSKLLKKGYLKSMLKKGVKKPAG